MREGHASRLSLLAFCMDCLLGWNGEGFVCGASRNASANVLCPPRGRENCKMTNVWQTWHTRQGFPRVFGILTCKCLLQLVDWFLFLMSFLAQKWMIDQKAALKQGKTLSAFYALFTGHSYTFSCPHLQSSRPKQSPAPGTGTLWHEPDRKGLISTATFFELFRAFSLTQAET